MIVIALTGGIASGKSTILQRFAELGAVCVDADQLAREAVAPGTEGLKQVRDRFGDELVLPDGNLNRSLLGSIVFSDPKALSDLNAIVHPQVRQLATQHMRLAEKEHPWGVFVYEIPLLIESGFTREDWDLVVLADTPEAQRLTRLVQLRGMTQGDARNRIAQQVSDAQRREIADAIIDTSISLSATITQVDQLWQKLVELSDRPPSTSQARLNCASQSS